mgnify:CR=1 FL=1
MKKIQSAKLSNGNIKIICTTEDVQEYEVTKSQIYTQISRLEQMLEEAKRRYEREVMDIKEQIAVWEEALNKIKEVQ